MKIHYNVIWGTLIFVSLFSCSVRYHSINELYEARSDVRYEEIEVLPGYNQSYLLWVEQPIDHKNPDKGTFLQRVWLNHLSNDAPVVFVTEGYRSPQNYNSELAQLLHANQIVVEHRFYGESSPENLEWQYLTIEQAAHDHQNIVRLFQRLYRGKWVSTGISKGGQAAIIHRANFPKSIDVTVAYVVPFNLERDDRRLIDFFDHVGTQQERDRIKAFQIEVLKRRNQIIPKFEGMAMEKGWTFSMGIEKAFELSVLEYPFSLWQWCVPVDVVPDTNASSKELFDQLYRGIDFSYFSDQENEHIGPFFIQAYSELGYYGYLAAPFLPYLNTINTDTISSDVLIPDVGFYPVYNSSAINRVYQRVHRFDPKMILITGANDPWSATIPDISGLRNTVHVERADGCHLTRIENLPDSLKNKVLDVFTKWELQH